MMSNHHLVMLAVELPRISNWIITVLISINDLHDLLDWNIPIFAATVAIISVRASLRSH